MTRIKSEVLLVSSLFFKGRFTVPWHQRFYDWDIEQVDELLADLKEALDEGRASYFLGTIMLVESGGGWEINDGQQRLITLCLLFAALSRQFSKRHDREARTRKATIHQILFDHNPNLDIYQADRTRDIPRIEPSRHDRSRFTQIIRGHDIGTNGKLTSAWNQISAFAKATGSDETETFFDFMIKNVEIVVLYVPQAENANAVFETLNGRGRRLDDVDLIRNHLYSYFVGPTDTERRITVHEHLESILATCRTTAKSQEYFRCFYQCRYGYIQKKRFYRETRRKIRNFSIGHNSGDYVYGMISDLADPRGVELFRTLNATNPSPELLQKFCAASGTTRKKRNLPTFLQELIGYKVAFPVIFALLRKFMGAADIDKKPVARAVHRCLGDLCSFVMRVSFCSSKFEPSRYEPAFANCARRISASTAISELNIRTDLKECDESQIMNDARFISRLLEVRMTDSRRAKRLLFGINREQESESDSLNFNGCKVEHVLPQSSKHWAGWTGFSSSGTDTQDWVSRIGNLTLMGSSDGRERSNADFATKKIIFDQSPIRITRELVQYDEWTPDIINNRSKEIAFKAAIIWSFPVLRN